MDFHHRLEDPESPEVKEFVEQQVQLCNSVLKDCETRETLKAKVTVLYDYPRYGCPHKAGNHFFYSHNSGLQAQSVLYMQVLSNSWVPKGPWWCWFAMLMVLMVQCYARFSKLVLGTTVTAKDFAECASWVDVGFVCFDMCLPFYNSLCAWFVAGNCGRSCRGTA
jgi:hypothetical protein